MKETEEFSVKLLSWVVKVFLSLFVVIAFSFLIYLLMEFLEAKKIWGVSLSTNRTHSFLVGFIFIVVSVYIFLVGVSALEVFIYKDYDKNREVIIVNGEIDRRYYYEQFIQKLTILLIEVSGFLIFIFLGLKINIGSLFKMLKKYYLGGQQYLFILAMVPVVIVIGHIIMRVYKLFIYEEKYVPYLCFLNKSLAKLEEKNK